MSEKKITLALIYGGQGCESEVSVRGAKNLLPMLSDMFNCLPIFIDKDGSWNFNQKQVFAIKTNNRGGLFCPSTKEFYQVDCAFPLLHGNFGEDGIIQSVLCLASIPYIGCDGPTGAICRDKAIVKSVAQSLNIPVLPYFLAHKNEILPIQEIEEHLAYPLFVKPTSLGSSIGASDARDQGQLDRALTKAFTLSDRVIIERLLEPKRELECAYFHSDGKELFTNPGEILCESEFYDFECKYNRQTVTHACADVDSQISKKIKDYSQRLVKYLGVRDICRIDFFLSKGELYFNEINTMPGFTPQSLYPRMIELYGISPRDMLRGLVLGAISRG